MNLEIIKNLSEKRDGGLKKIAADIGMSEQNLHRCIRNNKIQASDLEKISKLLGVSVSVFFDENAEAKSINSGKIAMTHVSNSPVGVSGDVNITDDAHYQERIRLLEQLVAEKERTIKLLMGR